MKRAIGYLRVSGTSQLDKDGEHRQRDVVHAFCKQHNLCLAFAVFEGAVSGTVEGMDRPQFGTVIHHIEGQDAIWDRECFGRISAETKEQHRPCIVVERLDRLARDLMVQEIMLKECRERGIQVYAADQGLIDLASNDIDPTRKLFRQMMGAIAEWEKSALVAKLRVARERKKAETGRCSGPLPYCRTEEGHHIVACINNFKHTRGLSYAQIAERLNEGGYKTQFGKRFTRTAVIKLYTSSLKTPPLKTPCEVHTTSTTQLPTP